ncbi:MAG: GNAT family N-acetyltransferase [Cytophagaceae bacterium]|nr:GNAT family N-acetyltransferase [Cytophagaceae bacterium]
MPSYEISQRPDAAEPPLPCRFERYLFNEPRHLRSQQGEGVQTFFLVNPKSNCIDARLSVFIQENEAISPLRATFGGVEFAENVPSDALLTVFTAAEHWAIEQKLTAIRLTQWPNAYAPGPADRLHQLLIERNYNVLFTEQNQHLSLNKPFEAGLHESARRRLVKAQRAGFTFQRWPTPDWAFVHAYVLAARQRKGHPMTLSASQLAQLSVDFPDEVQVFTVRDGEAIAALGVTVRVNARILYHFYPADAADYQAFSPAVLLTKGLYDWGRARGIQLLDLGISSVRGVPNEGLIRFKQNLGAQVSEKWSFEKKLDGVIN